MVDLIWISPFLDETDVEPILRDVFNGWQLGDGIFKAMDDLEIELPWSETSTIDSTILDIAYFGNHSGGKFCAPIVKLLLDDEGHVPSASREILAKILVTKYLTNWQHLWDLNTATYNPINNYDMHELRNLRTADSDARVESREGNETVNHGRTSTEMDYKYGLNTDTDNPRPSDRIDSTEGGDTSTDTESTSNSNRVAAGEEEEELHRAGNIGVTTTQKMIQEERELWLWNYFDQIFSDLDRELALMFHDSCRV